MPIQVPNIDDRRYDQLVDEAIARIRVHTPEYTNFNRSDPGVTMIEAFAFVAESLLYRANQIPERNRLKFLSLLGVPLQPASPARGMVVFTTPLTGPTLTLQPNVEVAAGSVAFRTTIGLDVLPVEAPVYYKQVVTLPAAADQTQDLAYYENAYRSYIGDQASLTSDTLRLYQTTLLEVHGDTGGVDLGATADQTLWIALLARNDATIEATKSKIAGKTISIGFVPKIDDAQRNLLPGKRLDGASSALIEVAIPRVDTLIGSNPTPEQLYRNLQTSVLGDVLREPGIIQVTLPSRAELGTWSDVDPQEDGVNAMPPLLDDDDHRKRLVTWLRIRWATGAQTRLLWLGINAATVTQRVSVSNERLGEGNGEPDQQFRLVNTSILSGTAQVTVVPPEGGTAQVWREIDDLFSAGAEVPQPDLRRAPGQGGVNDQPSAVFVLDAEAGMIRFGDGFRGRRPPLGAQIYASYAHSLGREGNVGAATITTVKGFPAEADSAADSIRVSNPVRTWGGAEAESASDGEKQIARYLQHRDRLVTREDFETIVRRTPGADIGRVEVLPAYHPAWSQEPGDAAGAVTLLLLPQNDPLHPTAPQPDQVFLSAVCDYLDPRRLVTTELYLRGPVYQPIWVSLGIQVTAGVSIAATREAVRLTLAEFLSPYRWPLRKSVIDRELMAVASRVESVQFVTGVRLALGDGNEQSQVDLRGLQLPQIMAIAVAVGEPTPIAQVRTLQPSGAGPGGSSVLVIAPIAGQKC